LKHLKTLNTFVLAWKCSAIYSRTSHIYNRWRYFYAGKNKI